MLPASLKAKMKNLIQTLEKEQAAINKKRTQSMQQKINEIAESSKFVSPDKITPEQ